MGLRLGSTPIITSKCPFGDKMRSSPCARGSERRELALDFVVHGDRGIAGPWAAHAKPGDTLEIRGPGGAYSPSPQAAWHLMVGDDAALPAIAVSLSRVPAGVPVFALIEVAGPEHQQPLDSPGDLELVWLHRSGGAGEDYRPMSKQSKVCRCPPGPARHSFTERPRPSAPSAVTSWWSVVFPSRPCQPLAIGSCVAPTSNGAPKSASGWRKRTAISQGPPPREACCVCGPTATYADAS